MPKRNSKIKDNEEKELLVFKNDILKLMLLDDMEIMEIKTLMLKRKSLLA